VWISSTWLIYFQENWNKPTFWEASINKPTFWEASINNYSIIPYTEHYSIIISFKALHIDTGEVSVLNLKLFEFNDNSFLLFGLLFP